MKIKITINMGSILFFHALGMKRVYTRSQEVVWENYYLKILEEPASFILN